MPLPDWYLERRRHIEATFARREEGPYWGGAEQGISTSPTGRCHLVLSRFDDPERKALPCSRGRIYQDGRLVADVKRNFGRFPFAWVDPHPINHGAYLICGEDYQGQTVIRCDTAERWDLIEEAARKGWGFCRASIDPNPIDPSLLAVSGCYWACPYELRFVRLRADGRLEELARVEDEAEFLGWVEGGTGAKFRREYEVVKSTGKLVRQLNDEEVAAQDALYARFRALPDDLRRGLSQEQREDLLDLITKIDVEGWDVAERFGLRV